jgi:hypothetical protein
MCLRKWGAAHKSNQLLDDLFPPLPEQKLKRSDNPTYLKTFAH